jgi:hypothetical protein
MLGAGAGEGESPPPPPQAIKIKLAARHGHIPETIFFIGPPPDKKHPTSTSNGVS